MILNNYKNLFKNMLLRPSEFGLVNTSGGVTNVRSSYAFESYAETYQTLAFYRISNISTSYTTRGVMFGDGSSANEDDYKLSGNIVKAFAGSASATTIVNDDGTFTKKAIYTITNTSDGDLTISEILYLGETRSGGSTVCYCATEHTVLDSPLVIPVGGVGQITYEITFDMNGYL